jgi:hypothetical protein
LRRAFVAGLEYARGSRKIGREGISGHIGVAKGVDCNAVAAVATAAAQVAGIDQHGVDHYRSAPVIAGQPEARRVRSAQHPSARHSPPLTAVTLVDYWRALNELAVADAHHQIAIAIEREPLPTLEAQPDQFRVRARREAEIIFKLAPFDPMVNQVDSGIDIFEFNPGVVGNLGAPPVGVVADKIIGFRGQLIYALDRGR